MRGFPFALIGVLALLLTSIACTHQPKRPPKAPVEQVKKRKSKKQISQSDLAKNSCIQFKDPNSSLPLWLQQQGIVVTRFLKECTTREGYKGYEPDSPWVAMGFPCTGGDGRIEVGGHYFAPKIISMILSTDCSMFPSSLDQVRKAGVNALALKSNSKLMALNPFAVQYWEIPGYDDADVGFTIDLRSVAAKQQLWKQFLEKKPIQVKLFGRENAWIRGYHFFYVDAELINTGVQKFQMRIKKVTPLDSKGVEEIRNRCESLQPRRNCSQVFS
ncbi:MAG: hypothetical protein HRU09_08260 [Oligoflexales bacterium]|nr:hypothetical protein [Oligoflexales bacterium]